MDKREKKTMDEQYRLEEYAEKITNEGDIIEPGKGDIIFRIEAKRLYIAITNLGGIIFGILLLYSLLFVRKSYTIIFFIIGGLIIVLYMVIDYLIWQKRGIRIIEIDGNGINFYRGKEKRLVRVDKNQITEIDFFSKLGRRVVTILTGGKAVRITPWITLFFGSRIRITDDAFNDAQFTLFIEKLKQLKLK